VSSNPVLAPTDPRNHREGEAWAWCEDCKLPFVIEDMHAIRVFGARTGKFVCRWHANRRREALGLRTA